MAASHHLSLPFPFPPVPVLVSTSVSKRVFGPMLTSSSTPSPSPYKSSDLSDKVGDPGTDKLNPSSSAEYEGPGPR